MFKFDDYSYAAVGTCYLSASTSKAWFLSSSSYYYAPRAYRDVGLLSPAGIVTAAFPFTEGFKLFILTWNILNIE